MRVIKRLNKGMNKQDRVKFKILQIIKKEMVLHVNYNEIKVNMGIEELL